MQQSDALKGDLRLRWFEDGRFLFDLPNDAAIAYAMIHFALDEIQERMNATKAEHRRKAVIHTLPKDGQAKPAEWGT